MNLAALSELEQRHIWDRDYSDASPWLRAAVGTVRTVLFVVREFSSGELTLRAMSLVYTTILSLVPLLAFSFSVLKGFGVQNQVEPLLLEYLRPLGDEKAVEIASQIVEFVNNIDVRVLGAMGLGLLVYTVVTLMQKIESAFNHAWRLHRDRTLGERFATFVSVLTVGPLLVFAALAITGSIMNNALMQWLSAHEPFGAVIRESARLVPYVLVIAAFTFVYVLVPNTRVRLWPALAGGIVAGVLWETAGFVFASFVAGATKYQAVYATFGTAMLFMIWLYVSWLILLVGASTAFYVQQPRAVIARVRRWKFSYASFEETALAVLATITRRHYERGEPLSAEALSDRFTMPLDMVERTVAALVAGGLLRPSADDPPRCLLAVPPETTPLTDVVAALRGHRPPGSRPARAPEDAGARAAVKALDGAAEAALGNLTLKDLADGLPAGSGEPKADQADAPVVRSA